MKQYRTIVIKATPSTIRLLHEHGSPTFKTIYEKGKYLQLDLPHFLQVVGSYTNNRPRRIISYKELQTLIMLNDNPEVVQCYLNKLIG